MAEDKPDDVAVDAHRLASYIEAVGRAADSQAFAALFRHFAPRVKAYLRRLGAERAMADELTQETFVSVWRRAGTFDRRQASAATWIFTIARNKRIDAIRRVRRPELDPNDPALVPPPPPTADELLDAAERAARLRAVVAALPEEQMEMLRRAFYDGQSHREIAAAAGLPLGTVKSRLRLALQRLQRALAGER